MTSPSPLSQNFSSPDVSYSDKAKLKALYRNLNPAALKRRITKLQHRLLRLNAAKQSVRKRPQRDQSKKIASRPSGEVTSLRELRLRQMNTIWNRFLCEATYIISYRFVCEATGRPEHGRPDHGPEARTLQITGHGSRRGFLWAVSVLP